MRTLSRWAAYSGILLILGGCNRPVVGVANNTYNRLAWIGEAYMKATDELDRAPEKVDELLPYLSKHGDPAEILRSDNDNAPFVILWGVDYRVYESELKQYPVTAYEKEGRGGLRMILQVRLVNTVTNENFRKAPFPPGQEPPI